MGLFSSIKKEDNTLDWTPIASVDELNTAFSSTSEKPGLFFKHSTTCPISRLALHKFEKEWTQDEMCSVFYIDLLAHRDVSNKLSELTGIQHESPQAILVKNEKPVYDASHNGISAINIKNSL